MSRRPRHRTEQFVINLDEEASNEAKRAPGGFALERSPTVFENVLVRFSLGWTAAEAGAQANAKRRRAEELQHERHISATTAKEFKGAELKPSVIPAKRTPRLKSFSLPASSQNAGQSVSAKLKYVVEASHLPHVNVILVLSWPSECGEFQEELEVRIGLCDRNIVDTAGSISLCEISECPLEGFDSGTQTDSKSELRFWVHGGGAAYASNLYLQDHEYGPWAAFIRDVRAMLDHDHTVTLLVRNAHGLTSDLKELHDAIKACRTANPMTLFIEGTAKNPVFELGHPPRDKRPKHALRARHTYVDALELLVVEGVGQICEYEWERMQPAIFRRAAARLLIPPGGGGSGNTATTLLAIIDTESVTPPVCLDANQPVSVRIRQLDKEDSRETRWEGKRVSSAYIPFMQRNEVAILIHSPGKRHIKLDPLGNKVIRIQDLTSDTESDLATLANLPPCGVDIHVTIDTSTIRRCLDNLSDLRDLIKWERGLSESLVSQTEDLLCGNRFDRLALTDLFDGVDDEFVEQAIGRLNPVQVKVFQEMRTLRARTSLIGGVAGSGKTEICVIVLRTLLQQRLKEENSQESKPFKFKALVVSPINNNADSLTDKIKAVTKGLGANLKIIRLFSLPTEINIARSIAEQGLGPDSEAPINSEADRIASRDLTHASVGRTLHMGLEKGTKHEVASVTDRRVKRAQLENSLGWHILERIGLVGEPATTKPPMSRDDERFKNFYQRYLGLGRGERWDLQEKLKSELHEAYIRVLEDADVIVCTPAQAHQKAVRFHVRPSIIVVDEAAKAPSLDVLGLYASFPCAKAIIMAGDTLQTHQKPKSNWKVNHFALQLPISLFNRLHLNHFPHSRMWVTQRFSKGICEPLSAIFTNVEMRSAETSFLSADLRLASDHLVKTFGLNSPLISLNINTPDEVVGPQKTRINEGSAAIAFHLVPIIVANSGGKLTGANIAILTPYTGQRDLLERTRSNMIANGLEKNGRFAGIGLEQVTIDSFDRSQGSQHDVVIADLTAASTVGYLNDEARLFTGLTRCRIFQIVLNNRDRLAQDSLKKPAGKSIYRTFTSYMETNGLSQVYAKDYRSLETFKYIDPVPLRTSKPEILEDADVAHSFGHTLPVLNLSSGGSSSDDSKDEKSSSDEGEWDKGVDDESVSSVEDAPGFDGAWLDRAFRKLGLT